MDYLYKSLNPVIGCKQHGFSEECDNCCALHSAQAQAHRKDTNTSKIYYKAITKIDGKWQWNDDAVYNPHWADHISTGKGTKPQKYIVSYMGEIGLSTPDVLADVIIKAKEAHMHEFIILTKLPSRVAKLLEVAVESAGVGYPENITVATSVGTNDFQYRIDMLRKVKGFKREVWHKPLLSNIDHPNYYGIDSVRINVEKGKHKRSCESSWIRNIVKEAKSQGCKVHLDMNKNDLKNITGRMKRIKNMINKMWSE